MRSVLGYNLSAAVIIRHTSGEPAASRDARSSKPNQAA